MNFSEQFSDHLDVLFDRLKDTVTYTPAGGVSMEVGAVVDYQPGESDGFTTASQLPTLRMDVRVSDIASPKISDLVSWDGVDYKVASRELNEDRMTWSLLLQEAS